MLHEPAVAEKKDGASEWKAKLGVKLFWVYSVIYMGFVGIAVFAPDKMKTPVIAGTNLAIIYGMSLIIFAIVLGLVYNHACTKKENEISNAKEVK